MHSQLDVLHKSCTPGSVRAIFGRGGIVGKVAVEVVAATAGGARDTPGAVAYVGTGAVGAGGSRVGSTAEADSATGARLGWDMAGASSVRGRFVPPADGVGAVTATAGCIAAGAVVATAATAGTAAATAAGAVCGELAGTVVVKTAADEPIAPDADAVVVSPAGAAAGFPGGGPATPTGTPAAGFAAAALGVSAPSGAAGLAFSTGGRPSRKFDGSGGGGNLAIAVSNDSTPFGNERASGCPVWSFCSKSLMQLPLASRMDCWYLLIYSKWAAVKLRSAPTSSMSAATCSSRDCFAAAPSASAMVLS